MKKYIFILLGFVFFINLVSASIIECYQENTNSSSALDGPCDLNYSGNYKIYGPVYFTNLNNFYDKNWGTYTNPSVGSYAYINVTYYKPNNFSSARWMIKDYSTASHANITLSSSCYNAYSDRIILRVYAGTCFSNNTKIKTLFRDKLIKDIKIGDFVLSYDERFKVNTYSEVIETFKHDSEDYLIINNNLEVTSNHQMYINNNWMEIGNARVGDILRDSNGNDIIINSMEKIDNKIETYNLEVENTHNYYANDYLAHNKAAQTLYHCFYSGTWNQIRTSGYTTAYNWYEDAMIWNVSYTSEPTDCWNYNSTTKLLTIPVSCGLVDIGDIINQITW